MQYLKGWNQDRLYQPNRCSCEHCCVSSNICAHCKDFNESINGETCNLSLKCTKCPNTYHRKCLPLKKRKPNSWTCCNEIWDGAKCEKYLDHFSFIHEMKPSKQTINNESLIYKKFNEIFPNKKLKITTHFGGFVYNKWTYLIQDCTEILLNGSESPGIARIIDIFSTQNKDEAYLAIQWYWHKNEFDNNSNIKNNNLNNEINELLFENNLNAIDIIEIKTINNKVKVCDTFEEYKKNQEKLLQLKRKKMEQIKILKQNNKNKFNKLCLAQNIKCYKEIKYDKVFWSTMSCNDDNKQMYKININDTNKKRIEIQNQILSANCVQINENKNHNKASKIDRKRKLTENKIVIMPKNKKRKIDIKMNEICNNNNNNNNGMISISKEEYNELKRQNKKYENVILDLQKSNAGYKTAMHNYTTGETFAITQNIELKEQVKDWKQRERELKEENKKMKLKHRDQIKELESKINKLEDKLVIKNDQIEYLRDARDAQRDGGNAVIPYVRITPIDDNNNNRPTDPRTKQRLREQNMNPNEIRQMF